ncbi:unnamed protein product, partial [Meganyctiphanes norvegica]
MTVVHIMFIELAQIHKGIMNRFSIDINVSGYTGIHDAAWRGDLGLIIEMVEAGTSVDLQTSTGSTPIYVAVQNGKYEAIKLLVKLGADVDKRETSFNGTALLQAAAVGQDLAIITLLDLGADINAKNIYANTALHMAAQEGHTGAVQVLLDHNADIHSRDYNGESPGTYWSSTVQVLLDHNADIHSRDYNGTIPLVDAEQRSKTNRDYDGTIRLLKAAMKQQNVSNVRQPIALYDSFCACTHVADCLETNNVNSRSCNPLEVCCKTVKPRPNSDITDDRAGSRPPPSTPCTLPSGRSGQCQPLDQCREQYEQILAVFSKKQFLESFGCTIPSADSLGVQVCDAIN